MAKTNESLRQHETQVDGSRATPLHSSGQNLAFTLQYLKEQVEATQGVMSLLKSENMSLRSTMEDIIASFISSKLTSQVQHTSKLHLGIGRTL